MTERSVDLRSTVAILRRNLLTLSVAAAVGVALGGPLAFKNPPEYSSSSLVLLPQEKDPTGQSAPRDINTALRIATSAIVLGPAGAALDPKVSAQELAKHVTVTDSTADILQMTATGPTREQAERRAQAVAEAQVAYSESAANSTSTAQQAALKKREQVLQTNLDTVDKEVLATKLRQRTEPASSVEGKADASALAQLAAQQADLALQIDKVQDEAQPAGGQSAAASIIENAGPARRPGITRTFVVDALGGMLAALFATALFLIFRGRRDRRLHYRDEIADALGSSVVASIRSQTARSVAGWSSMLQSYEPGMLDSWALRQVLRAFASTDGAGRTEPAGKKGNASRRSATIVVISLSDDLAGLAMGPQLAAYAATIGIRTHLVAGQRHESAAALWAACHRGPGQTEISPGLFVDTGSTHTHETELTVVVSVLDRQAPLFAAAPEGAVALIAVAAGSATAEELARAAVAVDDAGCPIVGLIVADPDDLDKTTGRQLHHERSRQVALPSRLSGLPSAKPAVRNVSGLERGNNT